MPNRKTHILKKHLGSYVAHSSVIFIRNSRSYRKTPIGASCILDSFLAKIRRYASDMIRISREKNSFMYNT